MTIFGKARISGDGSKRLRRFVRMVITVDDTPTLIQRIAEHRHNMAFCAAAVKGGKNTDPVLSGFYRDLREEARRQHFAFERIREKLAPVAAALGLHSTTPDAIQVDYYQVLGVSPDAAPSSIKKAYRRLALKVHPDTGSGGNDQFLALHKAYKVLSDPSLRRHYNLSRRPPGGPQWREDTRSPEHGVHVPAAPVLRGHVYLFILILCILAGVAMLADQAMRQRSFYGDAVPVSVDKMPPPGGTDPWGRGAAHQQVEPGRYDDEPAPDLHTAVVAEADVAMTAEIGPTPGPPAWAIPAARTIQNKPSIPTPLKKPGPVAALAEKSAAPGVQTPGPATGSAADDEPALEEDRFEEAAQRMQENLERFLVLYCRAYENRDLERFMAFFGENAIENGKPLQQLWPKYRENFQHLASIRYRIDLDHYDQDVDRYSIEVNGSFSLGWVKQREEKWNQFSGTISMNLVPDKDSFIIRELRYQFLN